MADDSYLNQAMSPLSGQPQQAMPPPQGSMQPQQGSGILGLIGQFLPAVISGLGAAATTNKWQGPGAAAARGLMGAEAGYLANKQGPTPEDKYHLALADQIEQKTQEVKKRMLDSDALDKTLTPEQLKLKRLNPDALAKQLVLEDPQTKDAMADYLAGVTGGKKAVFSALPADVLGATARAYSQAAADKQFREPHHPNLGEVEAQAFSRLPPEQQKQILLGPTATDPIKSKAATAATLIEGGANLKDLKQDLQDAYRKEYGLVEKPGDVIKDETNSALRQAKENGVESLTQVQRDLYKKATGITTKPGTETAAEKEAQEKGKEIRTFQRKLITPGTGFFQGSPMKPDEAERAVLQQEKMYGVHRDGTPVTKERPLYEMQDNGSVTPWWPAKEQAADESGHIALSNGAILKPKAVH